MQPASGLATDIISCKLNKACGWTMELEFINKVIENTKCSQTGEK